MQNNSTELQIHKENINDYRAVSGVGVTRAPMSDLQFLLVESTLKALYGPRLL